MLEAYLIKQLYEVEVDAVQSQHLRERLSGSGAAFGVVENPLALLDFTRSKVIILRSLSNIGETATQVVSGNPYVQLSRRLFRTLRESILFITHALTYTVLYTPKH